MSEDWSREEVELVVDDYLSMLSAQLAGVPYNKTEHRKKLLPKLHRRSAGSVEFKHQNISAVLLNAGIQSITGYKPRYNYQALLETIVLDRARQNTTLQKLAEADADSPIVVPEVDDILSILTERRRDANEAASQIRESAVGIKRAFFTNYLEREALNRSLGLAGEMLILNYERAKLIHTGKTSLADKVEHVSQVRGDQEGYDILSFEPTGEERLIEVKTTKYASETPFFVTRNELSVSRNHASQYHLYRLFTFRENPRLFTLPGAIDVTCDISAATYSARPK